MKANAGSGCSQYASSQSTGRSRSKLMHGTSVYLRNRMVITCSLALVARGLPCVALKIMSMAINDQKARFQSSFSTVLSPSVCFFL